MQLSKYWNIKHVAISWSVVGLTLSMYSIFYLTKAIMWSGVFNVSIVSLIFGLVTVVSAIGAFKNKLIYKKILFVLSVVIIIYGLLYLLLGGVFNRSVFYSFGVSALVLLSISTIVSEITVSGAKST